MHRVGHDAVPVYTAALASRLPYHVVLDRDAIWSRWPIRDAATLDLGEGWTVEEAVTA